MTEDKDTRKRLLAFLDRELFDAILQKRREQFDSKEDKQRFDDIKRKVAEERSRYHDNCPTAQDIKETFLRDVESRSSDRLNENLRDMGLPSYWDIKTAFLKLCDTYGV